MAQTKSRSTGSASPRRRTSTARGGNSNGPRATRQAQTPATASGPAGDGGGSAIGRAALPLATAAAGTVAGVLLGRRRRGRARKVLGVSIPGTGGGGVDALAKNIGEAGKQLSKLADEVRTGREKAEQIGKALS